MGGLAAIRQEGHILCRHPPSSPSTVSFSLPPHFTNLLWFHGFRPGPFYSLCPSSTLVLFIHLPQSSYSQATLYLSPCLSIFLSLSHSSPLITPITLVWREGGSRLLCLTDRSWVQTSPRGRPYQWPSLAELSGSLLFLAALFRLWSSPELCLCAYMCVFWHIWEQASLIKMSEYTKDYNCNLLFNSN